MSKQSKRLKISRQFMNIPKPLCKYLLYIAKVPIILIVYMHRIILGALFCFRKCFYKTTTEKNMHKQNTLESEDYNSMDKDDRESFVTLNLRKFKILNFQQNLCLENKINSKVEQRISKNQEMLSRKKKENRNSDSDKEKQDYVQDTHLNRSNATTDSNKVEEIHTNPIRNEESYIYPKIDNANIEEVQIRNVKNTGGFFLESEDQENCCNLETNRKQIELQPIKKIPKKMCPNSEIMLSYKNINNFKINMFPKNEPVMIFDLFNTIYPIMDHHGREYRGNIFTYLCRKGVDTETAMNVSKRRIIEYGEVQAIKSVLPSRNLYSSSEYFNEVDYKTFRKVTLGIDNEIVEVFKKIQSKKFIFSNGEISLVRNVLMSLGIEDLIDGIFYLDYHDESIPSKGSEYPYELINIHLPTNKIYYFDDSEKNIIIARRRGWNAFKVNQDYLKRKLFGVMKYLGLN